MPSSKLNAYTYRRVAEQGVSLFGQVGHGPRADVGRQLFFRAAYIQIYIPRKTIPVLEFHIFQVERALYLTCLVKFMFLYTHRPRHLEKDYIVPFVLLYLLVNLTKYFLLISWIWSTYIYALCLSEGDQNDTSTIQYFTRVTWSRKQFLYSETSSPQKQCPRATLMRQIVIQRVREYRSTKGIIKGQRVGKRRLRRFPAAAFVQSCRPLRRRSPRSPQSINLNCCRQKPEKWSASINPEPHGYAFDHFSRKFCWGKMRYFSLL